MSTAEDDLDLDTSGDGRDDIVSDIEAAFREHDGGEGEGGEPAARQAPDRNRDQAGRYAAGKAPEGAQGAEGDKTPATAAPGATGAAAAPAAASTAAPARAAPQSWSAEGKAAWASLPPAAQAEVARREGEVDGVLRQNAQFRTTLEGLDRATAPHRDLIQAAGGHEKAYGSLLNAQRMLMSDPVRALTQLAGDLGVQIQNGQFVRVAQPKGWAAPPQRPAAPPVDVNALVSQRVDSALTARDIRSGIEGFAARNPHFAALAPRVEQLVRAGLATGSTPMERLQSAYDQAAWADPTIRAQLQAEAAAASRAAAQASGQAGQRRATAARAAAVSVKGAPGAAPAGGKRPGNPRASLDDDIREAVRTHS